MPWRGRRSRTDPEPEGGS
uniref:Uncharacterized protein n=1 Tax=Arundo donax TaxID=35708 RepID=A0A0A9ETG3_ARUDO